jgi:hypothetical protein
MAASEYPGVCPARPARMLRRILILTLGIFSLCPQGLAQQASPQTIADELFAHSDWEKAAQAYSALTASDPKNGLAWQNLGECFLQLHKFDQAVQAFTAASEQNFRPLVNRVNVARAYAEKGDRDPAFKTLNEVVASGQGGRVRPFILSSTEFTKYREDAQFKSILEAIAPCKSPEFRQFDFWVGDWEVQDPAGNVVGQNLVTLEQDGCLIIEHWKDAGGVQTGTSFNYYDIRDKKWHQLYLDNSGNAGAFPAMAGDFTGGKMVLLTDEKSTPLYRWTWYTLVPDRVRQMAEQSSDGQKTWQIFWDSVYVRKSAKPGKSDAQSAKQLDQRDAALHPCENDRRYRAFDFWVGEWEVRPTGQPNAKPQHSSIQRILGGCVIFENYTYEGSLYEGKGFNIFDVNSGRWHQTYVDSTGTFHQWDGEVRDNVMYYVGANLTSEGGRSWDKITYFKLDNGHVRHLSQRSKDGGKTWDTYFDGEYTPVNATASKQSK